MVDSNDARAKKLKAFDHVIKTLNQEHLKKTKNSGAPGEVFIAKLGDNPPKVKTVSSGSLVLDKALGSGIPRGRIVEIFGPEASGKTSIALTAVANIQKEGGTAAYVDLEHALDPQYAQVLGVNTSELALAQPVSAEESLDLVEALVESEAVDMIVVDSIGALTPQAELEGKMEDQQVGLVARILGKGLRKIVGKASKTGTTIIFINQLRAAIGMGGSYGPKEQTTGGKAMKYTASQRIDIRRVERITENGEAIGNRVRFNIVKNKVAPPYAKGETVLSFGSGIDKVAELVEIGEEYEVIYKPNNRTHINGVTGERLGTSKIETLNAIRNDDELYNVLAERLSENLDRYRRGDALIPAETGENNDKKSKDESKDSKAKKNTESTNDDSDSELDELDEDNTDTE